MLVAAGSSLVLSLALTIVLGRALKIEDFGFFALVSTVFVLTRAVVDLGVGNVVAREAASAPAEERTRLEQLLGLKLALSAAAALTCAALALSQPSLAQRAVLLAVAVLLPSFHLTGLTTVFQVRQRQGRLALVTVLAQSLALAGAALLLALRAPGWTFGALVALRETAVVFGIWRLAARILGYEPRPSLDRKALADLVRLGFGYGASSLLYTLTFQQGLFFVRFLRPPQELGAFAAALRPVAPLVAVPALLLSPLVPLLSAPRLRPDAFQRQAWGTLGLAVGVGSVMAVAGAELAPAALAVLYGGRFQVGPLSAVAAFRWVSAALGAAIVLEAVAVVLLSGRRERPLLALSAAALVVNVAATLVLLPRLGFTGAAAALAGAMGFGAVCGLFLCRAPGEGASPFLRALVFLVPSGVLAAALAWTPMAGPPLLRLLVGGLLSLAALASLWGLPGVAAFRREQSSLSAPAKDGLSP